MTPEELVGQRIAEFRERLGLTQQQLGERVGDFLGRDWPRQTVHNAEKGKRAFTAAELFALAAALETWASRLLVPPLNLDEVELPSGVRLGRANIATAGRERAAALLDEAETAIRTVMHVTEQRSSFDREMLEVLTPILARLQELDPSDAEGKGDDRGDD